MHMNDHPHRHDRAAHDHDDRNPADAEARDHDHSHDHSHCHTNGHTHGHDHAHGHHGHHHHAPASFGPAFAIGAVLNIGFVIGEVAYGVLGHSVALLADAGHNLGDVLGLLVAWVASVLSRRTPSARFTYGLGSTSVLAALMNAVVLLLVTGAVALEAVTRLFSPQAPAGLIIMAVAAAGIVVNGVTAALFAQPSSKRGGKGDINVRAAFQHMLADALVATGVVVAGGLILLTHWSWLDPLTSLVVSGLIVWGTWGLLRESLSMALDAVPRGIEPAEVRGFLSGLPGVQGVHDLHIWSMSTTDTALTCHLLMPAGHPSDRFLSEVCGALKDRFGIGHATLQVETDATHPCALEPEHVV
jgi:cobalt-zinc-cadmium efflux system protein